MAKGKYSTNRRFKSQTPVAPMRTLSGDMSVHPPHNPYPQTPGNMGRGADNEPGHPPNGVHRATNVKASKPFRAVTRATASGFGTSFKGTARTGAVRRAVGRAGVSGFGRKFKGGSR